MSVLILCETSSVAVFEAEIRVKSMYSVYDKIVIENKKQIETTEIKGIFLHKSSYKRWFGHESHSLG